MEFSHEESNSNCVERLNVANATEFAEMPEEYRKLVLRQMTKHTEGELSGADDYALIFYPMAPNTYEKQVCFERGIEELDHFNLGAKVLADIGCDISYILGVPLNERSNYATEGVKEIDDWIERGLFSFIGEDAVMAHLIEMAESSYQPIREMMVSVIRDEKIHVAHGFRIIREITKTSAGIEQTNQRLIRMWPATLDLFGSSESKSSELYMKWGLRKKSNNQAREDFSAVTRPKLEALGLYVPPDHVGRKFN
jgi:ring-1,2-phenylacetyl-CoA epoxidase subunit PaaA